MDRPNKIVAQQMDDLMYFGHKWAPQHIITHTYIRYVRVLCLYLVSSPPNGELFFAARQLEGDERRKMKE